MIPTRIPYAPFPSCGCASAWPRGPGYFTDKPFRTRAAASPASEEPDTVTRGDSAGSSFGTSVRLRSEEHTSELQSRSDLVCRLLLEKKNIIGELTVVLVNKRHDALLRQSVYQDVHINVDLVLPEFGRDHVLFDRLQFVSIACISRCA